MISLISTNIDFQNKLKNIDKKILERLNLDDFTIDNMKNMMNFQDIEKIGDRISLNVDTIISLYEKTIRDLKIRYTIDNINTIELKHIEDIKKITEKYIDKYDTNVENISNRINCYYSDKEDTRTLCSEYLLIPFRILIRIILLKINNKKIEFEDYFNNINDSINDFYSQYEINREEFEKIIDIINDIYIKFNKKEYILEYNKLLYYCVYKTYHKIYEDSYDLSHYNISYTDTLAINKIYNIICNEKPNDKHSEIYRKYILSIFNKIV